jgi:hypothetical protein
MYMTMDTLTYAHLCDGWVETIPLDQSGGEETESETVCGGGVSSLRQLLQDFCGAAVVNKQWHPLLSEEWEREGQC